MKGKNLSFNKEVLLSYSKSISERYFRSRKEKESAISSAIFNTDELLTLEDIKPFDNNASDLILFELDGKEWKIKDFEDRRSSSRGRQIATPECSIRRTTAGTPSSFLTAKQIKFTNFKKLIFTCKTNN